MTRKGHNSQALTPKQIAALKRAVEGIEALEEQIDGLRGDKSEVYEKAREVDLDKAAIKAVVQRRRNLKRNEEKYREREDLVDIYTDALDGGTPVAHTRGPGREASAKTKSQGPHRETPAPRAAGGCPEPEPVASQDVPARNGGPATAEAPAATPVLSPPPGGPEFRETKPSAQLLDESLAGAEALGLGKPAAAAATIDQPEIPSF